MDVARLANNSARGSAWEGPLARVFAGWLSHFGLVEAHEVRPVLLLCAYHGNFLRIGQLHFA